MVDQNQEAQVQVQEEDIRYQRGRDNPGDIRNVILTLVVLLASATYHAVINPPGGCEAAIVSAIICLFLNTQPLITYYLFLFYLFLSLAQHIMVDQNQEAQVQGQEEDI
ncbi:hypothetical protein K1719_011094 [Acacia pycnantha]|nr:hypothetical protein K1719_011094 [Acacia pycnantha]